MWFFDNYTGTSAAFDSLYSGVYLLKSAYNRGKERVEDRNNLFKLEKAGLGKVRLRIDGVTYHGESR